jgi:hypothetical protein
MEQPHGNLGQIFFSAVCSLWIHDSLGCSGFDSRQKKLEHQQAGRQASKANNSYLVMFCHPGPFLLRF